ncbi:sugar phosphate nucleotidyltransferase [Desertibaculum subflavum]|uniref:sugar phosphate nucleotidyltransferase n=1 Tax=Desertibaculum subflavum TaxID=2268458 RepID=UPI0034D1A2A7
MTMPPLALLAGGLATRMRPATETMPKSLLEVAGEPFIFHQLRLIRAQGVARAVICVGFLGEMIRAAVGNGKRFGLEVEYAFDGPVLLGTGGALLQAAPLLGPEFLVMYGDSYLPTPFAPVVATFKAGGACGLMTVFRNEGRWDTSNVEYDGGRIRAYNKSRQTPAMRHIDYGLGILADRAFVNRATGSSFDLAELYAELLERGELIGYEVAERFYEIGSPAGLHETDVLLRGGKS